MFQRRRYFRCNGLYHGLSCMADDLRQAGILTWSSREYENAYESFVSLSVTYLFRIFDIMCIENDGSQDMIDQIAGKYKPTIYETKEHSSRIIDAYIDAMCQLARIPGTWILENYYIETPPQCKRKKHQLDQMLGIERLKNFSGWIERRTDDVIFIQLYLPPGAGQPSGFQVGFPISSCPALISDKTKGDVKKTSYLLPKDNDSQLRPYQSEQKNNIQQAWNEVRRVMFQMPTGTGKTRLFVSIVRDIIEQQPTAHILIVAHRTELISQISHSLSHHYGLRHEILEVKKTKGHSSILVASILRLSRRICKDERLKAFDYIFIDEAHHSLAPTYKKLIEAYPNAKVLGVTATPYRLKKATFTSLYDTLVESQPLRQFIVEGYLADYRLFTVSDRTAAMGRINRLTKFGADGDYKTLDLTSIFDTEAEIQRLYDCYSVYAADKKGIVYAVSRDHAAHIATLFNDRGVKAVSIDCDTPKEERQRLIDEFKSKDGNLQILVNVELFTEGFDCPSIEFVMLARPTRSLSLYLQQAGRALRPTPNGEEVVILDCAGLYNRFGLPERNRDWQSHFKGMKPKNEDYTKRQLGTPSVYGLMKEVERTRKELVHTDGNTCIFTVDKIRYGLCDKTGRIIFHPLYEKITPTPYGWYIGNRKERNQQYQDILSPCDAKTYPFRCIVKENDGIYKAEHIDSNNIRVLTIRFDSDLRLIPSKIIKVGTKTTIYLHGNDQSGKSFYTTSLALDALIYSNYISLQNEVYRMIGYNCRDSIIADNNISQVRKGEGMYEGDYLLTCSDWIISPYGTVYWPLRIGYPLSYTKNKDGITLFDDNFTPILRGESIEVHDDHCIIKRSSQPPLTIDYIDYLRFGLP